MAETPLGRTVFSGPFKYLTIVGGWMLNTDDPKKVQLYYVYKVIMFLLCCTATFSMSYDLYFVFGDYNEMTWNICTNILFTGSLIKNFYITYHYKVMNSLRVRLHQGATSREGGSPEDERLNRDSEKEMRYVRNSFFGLLICFIPVWLGVWYFSTPRRLPLPFYIPLEHDLNDEVQFNFLFFTAGGIAMFGMSFEMQYELCIFGILIQISREYKRLIIDIKKVNALYEDDPMESEEPDNWTSEMNPRLKLKTTNLLKEYCTFQRELIEYVLDFEMCCHIPLLIQVLSMILVMIALGIQALQFGLLSIHLTYQIGYVSVVSLDVFLLCWYCARIIDLCREVGYEIYATPWYHMNADIRKNICMMIMRAQRTPRITSGKMMELNLNAFMQIMSTVYSWLTLFKDLM